MPIRSLVNTGDLQLEMENNRTAKRVYVGECAGSHSVGRPQKIWIDTVKDCLRKNVWKSGKQGE